MSYLSGRGFTADTVSRFRLGLDEETGRLTIPYLTPAGPWSIKYRCIAHEDCKPVPNHTKYTYDAGAQPLLYNASALLAAKAVMLVEGELDAVAIEQIGVPAVGYPGAQTWKANSYWRWCFDSADDVFVIGDGDENNVGRKAAETVAEALRDSVSGEVHMTVLPEGEDSNSFINKYGEQEFLIETGWY